MTPRPVLKWYKGSFAQFAPIWVHDPYGECMVAPRGVCGFFLLPIAECMMQAVNFFLSMNGEIEPHFPIYFDDAEEFTPKSLQVRD